MEMPELSHVVRPSFSALPLRKDDPPYSAWGLWGKDDQLGTLNLLSPNSVRDAASEIREGKRFSLNWCLSHPKTPGFQRHKDVYSHTITGPGHVLDDTITFNTQKSTQWDGLRHFAYQKEQLFYNGTTKDEIVNEPDGKLGIHSWHEAGCIAGRGILLDYWAYAEATGIKYDAARPHGIEYDDLMACLQWQQKMSSDKLEPRAGDVLFIRSGFSVRYYELTEHEEREVGEAWPPASCGVNQDVRLLQWLWDNRFAAVGGDAPAWETFPADESAGFCYHEVLIAGWGCPVAELLWLEDLSKWCREQKRWTFFLSSCPLNVHGGVASPANMIALV
ncbi:hypothetical protein BGZ61DRAFT_533250 [Ilyonectria robusta]|uniref:uncharacterized protein n=1 Tax=Ilyonectria robusta TaxID=1079257 RepID=UPI001E8E207A|nr:uncharacterized protein BGZ61DRAFT_533250 [Ilyonectria robusta]KAH8688473.1 hypothetical protein BGZ61DRAFT_533250 [Ilyonectria robusta]